MEYKYDRLSGQNSTKIEYTIIKFVRQCGTIINKLQSFIVKLWNIAQTVKDKRQLLVLTLASQTV